MEAPDKIYIQERNIGGDIVTSPVWFSIEETDRVAYIRKDALLEWARENIHNGICKYAMKEIIDKIESL